MASATTSFVLVFLLAVLAISATEGSYPVPVVPILKDERSIDAHGNYNFAYSTGDGISRTEDGAQSYGQTSKGGFSYTSPEGVPVQIEFVADKGGFQPSGAVLPVAPPLPYKRVQQFNYRY
ncbi:endocuticle structural glycoprotein SgAbd-8-like [Oratosquilla oratoria]|uniref:endocuticle structural glycoprotein SgAbd-8-like n=1 Tax=Oratosquilla oratoria TaxID=337810 RepID=UPI003F75E60D